MKSTIKQTCVLLSSISLFSVQSCKEVEAPAPYGPLPKESQIRWQEMERYAFIHFSINSFTDIEWGYGDKDPALFNPTNLDCRQWCRIIRDAGMKGVILTAKHHDGFCLWPSVYTDYDIARSPWRDGKGDLVRELADACKEYGLKLGIYLSPWDRNHPDYGTEKYITYFRNQLKELLTNYGDVFEVWFDGANGGSGYYGGANETRNVDRKTYYNWPETNRSVYELQPDAVIFSDAGPDVRWCGNESGWVGETNWSTLRRDEVWPGWPLYEQLQYGHVDGNYWVPAEVNVSIRPGWFYHPEQDEQVKSVDQLLDIYYHSIGRNATWNLNLPIDREGRVHPADSAALMDFAEILQQEFKTNLAPQARITASNTRGRNFSVKHLTDENKDTYWATEDSVKQATLTLDFGKNPIRFNRLLMQEYIRLGQRVKAFTVEAFTNGAWQTLDQQTTIGYKRILRLPDTEATQLRITLEAEAVPVISNIELYNAPKRIQAPVITRNKAGVVSLSNVPEGYQILYSIDGSYPTTRYTEPILTTGKVTVKAIVVDSEGNRSEMKTERFDIDKKAWKVVDIDNPETADRLFDGDATTVWVVTGKQKPCSLTIDLGETYTVDGFRYLPEQQANPKGVVVNYAIHASSDGKSWKQVCTKEFDNIRNNPIRQTVRFQPTPMRFIRFTALSNTAGDGTLGCAEFDVLTTE